MGEMFITLYPKDHKHGEAVIRTAREEGLHAEYERPGRILVTIPGRYTGWNDLGRERRYRRIAGEVCAIDECD